MEFLGEQYIHNITVNSDFENRTILMFVRSNTDEQLPLSIKVFYNKKEILKSEGETNTTLSLIIDEVNFHPWSPKEPNLYDIEITMYDSENKKQVDFIKTYTSIRKIEKKADETGKLRMYLNGKTFLKII